MFQAWSCVHRMFHTFSPLGDVHEIWRDDVVKSNDRHRGFVEQEHECDSGQNPRPAEFDLTCSTRL